MKKVLVIVAILAFVGMLSNNFISAEKTAIATPASKAVYKFSDQKNGIFSAVITEYEPFKIGEVLSDFLSSHKNLKITSHSALPQYVYEMPESGPNSHKVYRASTIVVTIVAEPKK